MRADFPWFPIALMLGLSVSLMILVPLAFYRFQTKTLARVRAWAESEGIQITRIRSLRGFDLPRSDRRIRVELNDSPEAMPGSLLFQVRAVSNDGKPRKGYIRFPRFDNRFAPPAKIVWDSTGPRFDEV
jgi:hypothetical protein